MTPIGLGIPREEFGSCTVILVVPDLFCRSYIQALTELLLVDMGFAQACVQQRASAPRSVLVFRLAAWSTWARRRSRSRASKKASSSRRRAFQLAYGGNDLTNFLAELFIRAKFPTASWTTAQALQTAC